MLMLSVVLALLLGWCTGGRLSRFEEADLRLLPLPVLAFACQRAMNALAGRISLPFEAWAWLPLLLSYGLIFLFLWQNRRLKKTCLLVGAGGACNLAVIASNGWRMPVAFWAAALLSEQGAAALLAGEIPMYRAADASTRLLFLGDILYCPLPLFGGLASLGDILLAAGVFFCLMACMRPSRLPMWLTTG